MLYLDSAKSRALRALVPYVTRAVVPHVPRVLLALVLHVSSGLGALVPYMPSALRVLFFRALRASCHTCSHTSRTSYLTCSTVNHYDKQPLLKESFYSGFFYK